MKKMPRVRSLGGYHSKNQCVEVSGIWTGICLFAAHFPNFGPMMQIGYAKDLNELNDLRDLKTHKPLGPFINHRD